MCFSGRAIFACNYGHLYGMDMMHYASNSEQQILCPSCNRPMNFIGVVDDSRGESLARFWKELLYEYEEIESSFDDTTGIVTRKYKPSTWKIHYDPNKWFNYETGEEK